MRADFIHSSQESIQGCKCVFAPTLISRRVALFVRAYKACKLQCLDVVFCAVQLPRGFNKTKFRKYCNAGDQFCGALKLLGGKG